MKTSILFIYQKIVDLDFDISFCRTLQARFVDFLCTIRTIKAQINRNTFFCKAKHIENDQVLTKITKLFTQYSWEPTNLLFRNRC